MGCCVISAPYQSIGINIYENSYAITLKTNQNNCASFKQYPYLRCDKPMPKIQPVAQLIVIEFFAAYNPAMDPFLNTLANWLANCSTNILQISCHIESKAIDRFMDVFKFFKMNRLNIVCFRNSPTDYLESFIEEFIMRYPDILVKGSFMKRIIETSGWQ